MTGRSAKVTVRDANARVWAVKFGPEVHAETFATWLARALGYHSDATWYLARGAIHGVRNLRRASQYLEADGGFREARFEYRDDRCRLLKSHNWSWEYNPFVGSRELNGLKILTMLLSNWDHKDARDADSNTAIVECMRGGERRLIYYISDWGACLGKWGRKFFHTKWDCEGFAAQTPKFVEGVENGYVRFGFSSGRRSGEFKRTVTVEHARWFLARLAPISAADFREALRSSGADEHEVEHFTRALLNRIAALREVARKSPRLP